ncbi:MAG: regulatory protein MerR [Ilumatobacteraceae bacterium]|nr:regulatory protein MerR [Ilumatobacteraceae bacterium]
MKISELSASSGVSVATIKYYLREGLLSPGVSRSPNQADYGDEHLARLRLIRAMIDVGGLSIASVTQTLAAVDDTSISIHDAFGVAQDALSPSWPIEPDDDERVTAARREVDRWLHKRRWKIRPDAAAKAELADVLVLLDQFGWGCSADLFDDVADETFAQAAAEIQFVDDSQDRSTMMRQAVIGTVAFEQAYGAIRRLALEHHSQRRFGRPKR